LTVATTVNEEKEPNVRVFPKVSGKVQSAVFSRDGHYVLTGDADGAVKIWEADTGILKKSFYGHVLGVYSVAWSPNGRYIASGSWDNTIKIWDADISSGTRELNSLRHENEVYSVAFSPDSRLLVSSSPDKTIRIWDVANGREISVLRGHETTVSSVAFSPNGERIVSASADRTIIIWDTETGVKVRTLTGHTDVVMSATWSPNGKYIVSTSWDMTVRIWDAETGYLVRVIGNGVYNDQVADAKFSPDGRRIATVGGFRSLNDKGVIIYSVATGVEIRRFSEHSDTIVSVEWDSDSKRIVTASYDSTAKIYNSETGECIRTLAGNTEILRHAVLSKDGKRLVTGSVGNKVNIWNAETGVLERSLEFVDKVHTVAISPDGSKIAVGGRSAQINIWDLETGNELPPLRGHRNAVFDLVFHPEGRYLISASGDGTIRIWDVVMGWEPEVLYGHEDTVLSLALSTDGRRLVSGSYDSTVRIWEWTNKGSYSLLTTFIGLRNQVNSVAVSSDGKKAVSGSRDGIVGYYNLETGRAEALQANIYMNDIWSVAFSPDGRSIVAGTANNEILKWEINTNGTILYKDNIGLLGVPNSLSYTSDGKRILAGIADGTARLYNADDLSEIACFVYFTGEDAETVAVGRGGMSNEAKQAVSQIDGEWLTITPDGFYRGSPNGDRFINVLINGYDLTRMDAYSDFFHRPDVVWARLTRQPDPEMPGFTIQQAANFRPPAITILSPQPGTTVTNGTVSVSVSETKKNRPIEDIRILVNGVRLGSGELKKVKGTSGIVPKEGSLSVQGEQKSVQFTVPVMLVERGSNRIEVMAFNGRSWGYSGYAGSVEVNWQPPPSTVVPLPDLWILAVGVTKYDNAETDKLSPGADYLPLKNLNYCTNDAEKLVASFEAQKGKRYGEVHSRLLIEGKIEPTAANVRESLNFLEQAGQRDVVLLFMAGHGISEGGQFYFLTKDAVMEDGKVNPLHAVSNDAIKDALNLPGRRLVFIDACQSGGMDINGFMYSLRRTNAYMLSSSEGDKPSYEDNPRGLIRWDGHGVFSYSVIRGLNGMALPPNSSGISVLQLSGYVRNTVMEQTKGRGFLHQQKPVQYSWGFGDFDIAR
jgi:WD40 repeat protein